MNPNRFRTPIRSALATLCGLLSLASSPLRAEVVIDGIAGSGEGYTTLHTQAHVSNCSEPNKNALANLRYVQIRDTLHLFIAGRVKNNAILLFLQTKAGGVNRITPDLIDPQPNGEEAFINQLARDATHGMTFETGFQPNLAIRILGEDVSPVKHAYVDRYDLVAGTHAYVGDALAGTVNDGPIRSLRMSWAPIGAPLVSVSSGVEIALNLSELGVAPGAQTVKLSAILVNPASEVGYNQVLGSLVNNSSMGINGDVTTVDFQADGASQTLAVPVTGLNPALDQDGDGLSNGVETGTGIWGSAEQTGSDPYLNDSDGDGYLDGPEVAGTSGLGYASNPNLPNYTTIGVPGSFHIPTWQLNPATAMGRESNDLTGQYHWLLDYKFSAAQLGSMAFKFASNAVIGWGLGDAPGTIKRDGNNIPGFVAATGLHRIDFDQAALTYTFGRRVFASSEEFLTAYGLAPGTDGDEDGIPNENEFYANTDPTNPDSDGDGINDLADSQPLQAIRDIVFRVDLHIQIVNGYFTPRNGVKVRFFSGASSPGELVLEDPDGDDIYTGTLTEAEGPTGASFGDYQFSMYSSLHGDFITEPNSPIRTFALGPAHSPQVLPVVFFNDINYSNSYDGWANSYSSNPGPGDDDPDRDTFSNYQEFLFGTSPIERTGSLTSMERTRAGLVMRWLERTSGASYRLEETATLIEIPWSASAITPQDDENQSDLPVGYVRKTATLPFDQPCKFIRISARE